MTDDKPTPTDEQHSILDKVRSLPDNLVINALAGTGKTTTLEMIQDATKVKPILYLCFNKRIAEEAEKKFPSTTTIRTFNSLGHRIWAKAVSRNLKLNPRKSNDILKDLISSAPKSTQPILWESYWEVIGAIGLAKSLGYIPDGKYPQAKRLITKEALYARLDEEPDELVQDLIDEVLTQSIKSAYDGYIDYNDQIYMPALFGGTFPRYPFNFVDEAQDLNPTNHVMLDKLGKQRICIVGDPFQSIYAFRGAVQSGMAQIAEKFKMNSCDLSISFRCKRTIVESVRWRVPHFKWMKEGGHVEQLRHLDPDTINDGVDEKGVPISAIICRNNAPLFRTAMRLLAMGRSVRVAGSDIGPKLVALLRKLGDEDIPRSTVHACIDEWLSEKLAKNNKTARDMADCMRVFADHGNTLREAIAYAEHVLKQEGKINLLTGHKAKGLEFDTVYHLDPFLIRDDEGDGEQEMNVRYVIQTRAKSNYYEIESRNIKWGE